MREQRIQHANNNQLDAMLLHSITQCLADTPLGKSSPFALQSMLKIKVEITDGNARVLIKYSVSTAGRRRRLNIKQRRSIIVNIICF